MRHGIRTVPSSSLELLNEVLNGELLSSEAQSLASQVAIDRNFRHPRFRATQSFKQYALSTSDIEALQAVADKYGMKSFDELKALTHEMVANKRAWNSEGRIVNNPTMAFEDFFEEEDDALSGAFEDMLETDALRKVFGTVPV